MQVQSANCCISSWTRIPCVVLAHSGWAYGCNGGHGAHPIGIACGCSTLHRTAALWRYTLHQCQQLPSMPTWGDAALPAFCTLPWDSSYMAYVGAGGAHLGCCSLRQPGAIWTAGLRGGAASSGQGHKPPTWSQHPGTLCARNFSIQRMQHSILCLHKLEPMGQRDRVWSSAHAAAGGAHGDNT